MTRLVPASLTLVAALAFAPDANAKAYYAPLSEVENQVEAVAIVDAASVTDVDIEGEHWQYHDLVDARVVDAVAGTLPSRIEIVGGRDFICAPVRWDAGTQYLALLVREGDRWTATNNEWGRLEIVDGKVAWPYDDSDDMVPIEDITKMLEARLEGRLGRGRIADSVLVEPEAIEPEFVVATPPSMEATADEDSSPAPWIAVGAVAVVLGFVVGTRRRR